MAETRISSRYSILLCFIVYTFYLDTKQVCGLQQHKLWNCSTDNTLTVNLACPNNSVIHVLSETYSNSSSSDTCKQDYRCHGQTAENNKMSSHIKLQTNCNSKTQCTEYFNPQYFSCSGRHLILAHYECVPESVNFDMCSSLTETVNDSLFLRNPQSHSDNVTCRCEIQGKNIQVIIADFYRNKTMSEKWYLNITSDLNLNYQISSNTTEERLINNIIPGYGGSVFIEYYSQTSRNHNIWIQVKGSPDVLTNLSCTYTRNSTDTTASRTTPDYTLTSTSTTAVKRETDRSTTAAETTNMSTEVSHSKNQTTASTTITQSASVTMFISSTLSSDTTKLSINSTSSSLDTTKLNINSTSSLDTTKLSINSTSSSFFTTKLLNNVSTSVFRNHSALNRKEAEYCNQENNISTVTVLSVLTAVLFLLLVTVSSILFWHLRRHNRKTKSNNQEMSATNSTQTNQNTMTSDGVYEVDDVENNGQVAQIAHSSRTTQHSQDNHFVNHYEDIANQNDHASSNNQQQLNFEISDVSHQLNNNLHVRENSQQNSYVNFSNPVEQAETNQNDLISSNGQDSTRERNSVNSGQNEYEHLNPSSRTPNDVYKKLSVHI